MKTIHESKTQNSAINSSFANIFNDIKREYETVVKICCTFNKLTYTTMPKPNLKAVEMQLEFS